MSDRNVEIVISGKNLASATMRDVETSTDHLVLKAGELGRMMGIGFGVERIVEFGKHVVENAHEIEVMAARMDVGVEAAQRFQFAADQTGTSLETLTRSIGIMQKGIVEDTPLAAAALEKMGLKITDLREMAPDAAFMKIAEAIRAIPDPMLQSEAALRIFGRAGQEILPAIRDGFADVANGAAVMSEETVRQLSEAEKEWKKFKNTATVYSGDLLAQLRNMLTDASGQVSVSSGFMFQPIVNMIAELGHVTDHLPDVKGKLPSASAIDDLGMAAAGSAESVKRANDALKAFTKEDDKARVAAIAHAKAIQDLADQISGRRLAQEARDLAAAFELASRQQHLNAEQLTAFADAAKKLADGPLGPSVLPARLWELWRAHLSIADITPKVNVETKELLGQFENLWPVVEHNAAAYDALNERLEHFQALLNKKTDKKIIGETPSALPSKPGDAPADPYRPWIASLEELARVSHGAFGSMAGDLAVLAVALKAADAAETKFHGSAGIASALFSSSATSSEKWASAVQTGTTVAAGAMDVWGQSAGYATQKSNELHGALAGAKAGAAFGPYGMAIGAATGAIVAYVRSLNDGREAVKNFATAHRGFDALHAQLLQLGDAGEQMWIKLTQKTGKGDTKAAAAIIDEINQTMGVMTKYGVTPFDSGDMNVRQKATDDAVKMLLSDLDTLKTKGGIDTPRALDKMSGSLSQLVVDAKSAGTKLPATMEPYLVELAKAGKLSKEAVAALTGAAASTGPTWQQLQSDAEKYGVDLAALGPNFQQGKISETAQGIVDAFNEMNGTGADTTKILDGMKDEVQNVVTNALKFGTDVPASMQPMLQKMIDLGMLTDDNGEKMTDLSKLNFAKPIEDSVNDLVKSIHDLIESLVGPDGVSGSINKIPKHVDVTVQGHYTGFDGPPGGPDNSDSGASDNRDQSDWGADWGGAQAFGGDYRVTRPTLFLAGEAGPEYVRFSGGNRTPGWATRAARTAPAVTINVALHGQFVDAAGLDRVGPDIAKQIAEEIRTSGTLKAMYRNAMN